MKNNDFELLIGSPIDREKLICEIYYKEEIIAEISQETNQLMLEIYPSPVGKPREIPLNEFQKIFDEATKHLLN